MEYTEYKKILDDGMVDYINSGGSVLYMGNTVKEYVFDYDNLNMSYDDQKRLEDKAVRAIIEKKRLPGGIRLKRCVWRGKAE